MDMNDKMTDKGDVATGTNLGEMIDTCARWIVDASHVVVFTGAGISTASGLPDFRGPDGLWTRRDKGLPPPRSKVPFDKVKPNEGHYAIVELERLGKVQFLISQNVDGLHLDSGFPRSKIAELHGNKNLMMCMDCEAFYTREEIGWNDKIHGKGYRNMRPRPGQPSCPACGGRLINSIVNFEDPLPARVLEQAVHHSARLCDLMIVLGSSLVVHPACECVGLAKRNGARVVINNKGRTPYDHIADLLVPHDINSFFPPVVEKVKEILASGD